MSELKKCPCCPDGKGELWAAYDGTYCVQCDKCGLTTLHKFSKQDVAAAWNSRAQLENKPLTRCENCARWDKSITFMSAHACAHWSPSRKEPRYTEWFEFCSFAEAKHEREEHHEAD